MFLLLNNDGAPHRHLQMPSASNNMSKEESIYIGEPMSDEEFEAYMKRMDDPNDLSDERWFHIFCEWLNHCMDINWDGSYYDSILIQKKAGHESEIKGFIDRRIVEGRNLNHEMKTWVVAAKFLSYPIPKAIVEEWEKVK